MCFIQNLIVQIIHCIAPLKWTDGYDLGILIGRFQCEFKPEHHQAGTLSLVRNRQLLSCVLSELNVKSHSIFSVQSH